MATLAPLETRYAWGDFFGYQGAAEFTAWARTFYEVGTLEHTAAGLHDAAPIAKAASEIRWGGAAGASFAVPFDAYNIDSATEIATGTVEIKLIDPMPSTSYRPLFFNIQDPDHTNSVAEPPLSRRAALDSIIDTTTFRVRLRRGSTPSTRTAANFSFGVMVFDFT